MRRILIVDDTVLIVDDRRLSLGYEGFDVLIAGTGYEALARAVAEHRT